MNSHKNTGIILGVATAILAVGLLIVRVVLADQIWLSAVVGTALVVVLAAWIRQNQKVLKSRSAAYGLNSFVTILLVLAILGVLNFLGERYPHRLDLTKNKLNTLSEQTVNTVKNLRNTVHATLFSKPAQKEQFRLLLDEYKTINPKFEVEYVDPDKEPSRAKAANIRKYGTLLLSMGTAENGKTPKESQIDDVTEEKLTNALIKLTKEKNPMLCTITGHGEKSFSSAEADGYSVIKQQLQNQSDDVKEVNLVQEGKIPDDCNAIAIIGPTKSFFDKEIELLKAYFANGGRAIIAIDLNVKGPEYSPELEGLLATWNIKPVKALVVDPLSKLFGVDAAVPLLTEFSKSSPITKDSQGNVYFPFARPIDIVSDTPGITPSWLAKTSPKSFGVMELKEIVSGAVSFNPKTDRQGPLIVAAAVEGKLKDSKAAKNTRIVVFGSSNFSSNNYSRYGSNVDLFLNATSWALEDESMISIHTKQEGPGRVDLTQEAGSFIFILTVIVIPFAVAVAGIVIWVVRKRL